MISVPAAVKKAAAASRQTKRWPRRSRHSQPTAAALPRAKSNPKTAPPVSTLAAAIRAAIGMTRAANRLAHAGDEVWGMGDGDGLRVASVQAAARGGPPRAAVRRRAPT